MTETNDNPEQLRRDIDRLCRAGQAAEAESLCRRALKRELASSEIHEQLADILMQRGRYPDATDHYKLAIGHGRNTDPRMLTLLDHMALSLKRQGRLSEAAACCRQIIKGRPDLTGGYTNLGACLKDMARHGEALDAYRTAIETGPDLPARWSNYLLCMNYAADFSRELIFEEHRQWGERFIATLPPPVPHENTPDPDRPLRVGFLSAHFRRHASAFFMEPLIANLDTAAYLPFCYAEVPRPDALTRRFMKLSKGWYVTCGRSDEEVAERVREDGIDILIDINGHVSDNRLGAVARRPAPVQVSWMGYPNTTGLPVVDHIVTDAHIDPPEGECGLYVEQPLRLPGCFVCYRALDFEENGGAGTVPDGAPPPCEKSGYITFGCFNNYAKVTADVLGLWARVMQAVPDSRLLIKTAAMADRQTADRLAKTLASRGIDCGRLVLQGRTSRAEHVAAYADVDIALDPFPYNGHTTTCEALWMGVPVVTLAGEQRAGRVGLSFLNTIGLDDLVAGTEEEYVAIAADLADDTGRLRDLRDTMRDRMSASPLCDYAGFAENFQQALRGAWRAWISNIQPDSALQ